MKNPFNLLWTPLVVLISKTKAEETDQLTVTVSVTVLESFLELSLSFIDLNMQRQI